MVILSYNYLHYALGVYTISKSTVNKLIPKTVLFNYLI